MFKFFLGTVYTTIRVLLFLSPEGHLLILGFQRSVWLFCLSKKLVTSGNHHFNAKSKTNDKVD